MRILLDTHILLWALAGSDKLSPKAQEMILSKDNEIFYSTAAVWEVSIKHSIHPENMPVSGKELSEYCQKAGYEMLSVRDEHVYALETLMRLDDAPRHNDPFDRIMVAQAKSEEMLLLTHDSLIPYYNEKCIVLV